VGSSLLTRRLYLTANLQPFSRWISPRPVERRVTEQFYLYMLPLDSTRNPLSHYESPGLSDAPKSPVFTALRPTVIPPACRSYDGWNATFDVPGAWLQLAKQGRVPLTYPTLYLLNIIRDATEHLHRFVTWAAGMAAAGKQPLLQANRWPRGQTIAKAVEAAAQYDADLPAQLTNNPLAAQRFALQVCIDEEVGSSSQPGSDYWAPIARRIICPAILPRARLNKELSDLVGRRAIIGLSHMGPEFARSDKREIGRSGDPFYLIVKRFENGRNTDMEVIRWRKPRKNQAAKMENGPEHSASTSDPSTVSENANGADGQKIVIRKTLVQRPLIRKHVTH
jgi:hypothetical protein